MQDFVNECRERNDMVQEPYGYYYLHENGDLIWKKLRPEIEPGGPVKKVWPLYPGSRGSQWLVAIEALALGAKKSRIDELSAKWGLTDDDALEFVKHATLKDGTPAMRLFKDGNRWCATFHDFVSIEESPAGFGSTALEALAELAKPDLLRNISREKP